MALGVTNGPQNGGLNGSSTGSPWDVFNPACYGLNVSSSGPSTGHMGGVIGVTTDPSKSGLIAQLSGITLGTIPSEKFGHYVVKY